MTVEQTDWSWSYEYQNFLNAPALSKLVISENNLFPQIINEGKKIFQKIISNIKSENLSHFIVLCDIEGIGTDLQR